MREKSDRACPRHHTCNATTAIRLQCIVILSNCSLEDWRTLSVQTLSTLTFKNHTSTPLAIPRPPNWILMLLMSSSNTFAHRNPFDNSLFQRNSIVSCNTPDHLWKRPCESHQAGFPRSCLHLAPQKERQQPHRQLFGGGPSLSSGHFGLVIQFHCYDFGW